MCLLAREPWIKLPIYALAQTLGAFLGAGIVFGLYYGKCGSLVPILETVFVTHCRKGGFQIREEHFLAVERSKKPPYSVSRMAFPFSWWWIQASLKQSEGQPALSKCKSLPLNNEHWTSSWPLLYLLVFQKSQWNTSSDGGFISVHCSRAIFSFLALKKIKYSLWCLMHHLVLAFRKCDF